MANTAERLKVSFYFNVNYFKFKPKRSYVDRATVLNNSTVLKCKISDITQGLCCKWATLQHPSTTGNCNHSAYSSACVYYLTTSLYSCVCLGIYNVIIATNFLKYVFIVFQLSRSLLHFSLFETDAATNAGGKLV